MNDSEYDPKLFKKKREVLGINATELAEQCKLAFTTIYNVEAGRSTCQSTILLIGLVLDILADEAGMMDVFYEIEKGE